MSNRQHAHDERHTTGRSSMPQLPFKDEYAGVSLFKPRQEGFRRIPMICRESTKGRQGSIDAPQLYVGFVAFNFPE